MEQKDTNNITFSHTVISIASASGKKFSREKFQPKIDLIKEYFPSDWQDKSVLDVGIGYGSFLSLLEEHGFENLFGMDPFQKSIAISKEFTKADLREGKIENEKWPFQENMFDVITSFDVVEHLHNPQIFFMNAKKYLRANGIIIFSTPNKQLPYHIRSIPFIGIPDRNPTHFNVQHPSYWINLVKKSGFNIIKMWKGEHLTHIKFLPPTMKSFCRIFKLDPRDVPVINWFEQSFCMALKVEVNN